MGKGDSHLDGRDPDPILQSPMTCLRHLWETSGFTPPSVFSRDGVSGCSLQDSNTRYTSNPIPNVSFAWFQESGNQDLDGQRTPDEWLQTFLSLMREVSTDHPLSVRIYESSYSFGPDRQAQPYRDWDPYNVKLIEGINTLKSEGITVVLIPTDSKIKLLVSELGYDIVCFPTTHINAYHFQGPGNLLVALLVLHTLNYDISSLDYSGINLSAAIIQSCINVASL